MPIQTSEVSVTGTGSSEWLPLDIWREPLQFSGYVEVTGTVTFDVVYTYDDIRNPEIKPIALEFVSSVTGLSVTTDFFSEGAINGIRVTNTAGTGTSRLVILTSGGRGS